MRRSVVIAARPGDHDVEATLAALEPQLDDDTEVLVVADHAARLVPELWAEGLAAARGESVLLTSGGLAPAEDWLSTAGRVAASTAAAAVGGAIEPGPGLRWVDWALYFCRYAAYGTPVLDPTSLDPAADNALYRADVLARYRARWEDGFWEPFVHTAMRADGFSLIVDPALIVYVVRGHRPGAFARQRFRHGRIHGQRRAAGRSRTATLVGSVKAPAVPALMALRAGRHLWRKRRHRARFVATLPLVLWFFTCWAAGELVGELGFAVRGRR